MVIFTVTPSLGMEEQSKWLMYVKSAAKDRSLDKTSDTCIPVRGRFGHKEPSAAGCLIFRR